LPIRLAVRAVFFLAAYDFLTHNYELDKAQKHKLKYKTFFGNEIVANTRRLCLMNMFLHNIGEIDGDVLISPNDSLWLPPARASITCWPILRLARKAP